MAVSYIRWCFSIFFSAVFLIFFSTIQKHCNLNAALTLNLALFPLGSSKVNLHERNIRLCLKLHTCVHVRVRYVCVYVCMCVCVCVYALRVCTCKYIDV